MAEIRKSRGLTQAQFAELLDIESETVSRFETGNTMPSVKRLCEMADALKVDLSMLVIDGDLSVKPDSRVTALLESLPSEDIDWVVELVQTLSRRLAK